jgi:hypothetical protein
MELLLASFVMFQRFWRWISPRQMFPDADLWAFLLQSHLRADAPVFVPQAFSPGHAGAYAASRPPIAPSLPHQAGNPPPAWNTSKAPAPAWVKTNRENGVRAQSPTPAAPQTPPGYASAVAAGGGDSGSDGTAEDDHNGQGTGQAQRTPVLTQLGGMPLPSPVVARRKGSADAASRTACLREVFEDQAGPAGARRTAAESGGLESHVPAVPKSSVSNPGGDGQIAGTAKGRRQRNMQESGAVTEISSSRDGAAGAGRIVATASSGLHAHAEADASRPLEDDGFSVLLSDVKATRSGSVGAAEVPASPLESARKSLRASLDGEDGLGVSIYEQLAHSLDPSANQSLGLEVGLPPTHLRRKSPPVHPRGILNCAGSTKW